MRGQRRDTDRPRFPRFKDRVGEDPARFLATDMDPTPRIRGIMDVGMANAYLEVAREIGISRRVTTAIERKRDSLLEQQQAATDGGAADGD